MIKLRNAVSFQKLVLVGLLALGLFAASVAAHAQVAITGGLYNFDAANTEGKDANGFEIQMEGIHETDLFPSTPAYCSNRYGCPTITPYATGVFLRYESPYDSVSRTFTQKTVARAGTGSFAGTCYSTSPSYATAGCDHFGVHLIFTAATRQSTGTFRWMFPDPVNPGQLIASANSIFVPQPFYTFGVPAPGLTPPLVATVQVPPPPPPPPAKPLKFGDATWVKIYVIDIQREVGLDELIDTNAVVPQDPTEIETEWSLLQPAPPGLAGSNPPRIRQVNSGNLAGDARAVVRRYETHAYTGVYSPVLHEAICGNTECVSPLPGEVGALLTAQMTAANVAVPGVAVSVVGAGKVQTPDRIIVCGTKCASNDPQGSVVNLTATPAANNVFSAWSGACTGALPTCAITVTDLMNVTATFAPAPKPVGGGGGRAGGGGTSTQFTLSVGRSNVGTVTATPDGVDHALNCGHTCSAKFNAGTVITLTATPPSSTTFAGWSGACAGTVPTCTVTIKSNTSVQAIFNK